MGLGGVFKKVSKGVGGFGNWLDVTKPGGFGDILTFGTLSQAEATKEAKKARSQAQEQYAAATAAAEKEAGRLANLEEERKRRLLLYGTGNPPTLMGSYLGVQGPAQVGRATLG